MTAQIPSVKATILKLLKTRLKQKQKKLGNKEGITFKIYANKFS